MAAGMPADRILCPESPGEAVFLEALRSLRPDLCVTAAYGNYLPSRFLAIPPCGTLNIHPSLLPAYRGAAPVQRALQDGLAITGVSLLYTVRAMDAGPILAQKKVPIDPEVQAPQLLEALFEQGTQLLLDNLELVWAGMAPLASQPQDEARATHAPKLAREEAALDFRLPALALHNQVRAFAGWPGSFATFALLPATEGCDGPSSSSGGSSSGGSSSSDSETLELKVLHTRVVPLSESPWASSSCDGGGADAHAVSASKAGLYVRCSDGSALQLLEVQPPGKRAMGAQDLVNGLKGRSLRWLPAHHA